MSVGLAAVLLSTALLGTVSFMTTSGSYVAFADWPFPMPFVSTKNPAQERQLMTDGMTQQIGMLGQSQGTGPVHRNRRHGAQRSTHMMPVERSGELRRLQVNTSSAVQNTKPLGGHDDAQIARYVILAFLSLPFVSFMCFLGCRGELMQARQ